jgi:hypothetical protein
MIDQIENKLHDSESKNKLLEKQTKIDEIDLQELRSHQSRLFKENKEYQNVLV